MLSVSLCLSLSIKVDDGTCRAEAVDRDQQQQHQQQLERGFPIQLPIALLQFQIFSEFLIPFCFLCFCGKEEGGTGKRCLVSENREQKKKKRSKATSLFVVVVGLT